MPARRRLAAVETLPPPVETGVELARVYDWDPRYCFRALIRQYPEMYRGKACGCLACCPALYCTVCRGNNVDRPGVVFRLRDGRRDGRCREHTTLIVD